jgi:hypothetical protein
VWDTLQVLLPTIMLKRSPHNGRITLDSVLASVSSKIRGWTKAFFVEVFMTGFALGVYSSCLAVQGKDRSLVSNFFHLGSLDGHLVVGFLDDILTVART